MNNPYKSYKDLHIWALLTYAILSLLIVYASLKPTDMRILQVTQLKAIKLPNNDFVFPLSSKTKIILDKKNSSSKKIHELVYQQGASWGQVNDRCEYLTNDDLLRLEADGMIEIKKSK